MHLKNENTKSTIYPYTRKPCWDANNKNSKNMTTDPKLGYL